MQATTTLSGEAKSNSNAFLGFFTKNPFSKNKTKYIISILAILAVIYFAWGYFFPTAVDTTYTLTQAKKETLTTYVSSTGQIIVKNQVDVKFQNTGNVTSVRVAVGQSVKRGQALASIDARSALVSLKQAEGSLASARASYKKVLDGATEENILSLQSQLDTSKVSLTTSKQNAITKILDTYTQVNDIVVTKTNIFFQNPNTTPSFAVPNYSTNNQVLQSSIEQQRTELNTILPIWKSSANSLTTDGDIEGEITRDIAYLNKVGAYLDNIQLVLNANNSSDTNISSYRSTISSARSSVSSLISNLTVAQQSITSAKSQVNQNQASLDLKKSPPSAEDVTIAQSQVTNAEANYLNAQNTYANTTIVAPFDAVVGAVGIKVGDQSGSTAAITLITPNQMAELSLNEVDATKIAVGQKAVLTFDAVADLTLAGTVAEISPLGTVTQGVVTYVVKIGLDTTDTRIKPGMSVTANIITNVREDTLAVPSEAVKSQGTVSYVEVPATTFTSGSTTVVTKLPQTPSRATVRVGVSNDTSVEILEGLQEGDWVITKTTTGATAKAATQQSGVSLFGGSGRPAGR